MTDLNIYSVVVARIEYMRWKPSWIDIVRFYEIDSDKVKIKIIGHLSGRDVDRLKVFYQIGIYIKGGAFYEKEVISGIVSGYVSILTCCVFIKRWFKWEVLWC